MHAGLANDHDPLAKRFGLANTWIDRRRISQGGSWGAAGKEEAMPETDFVFFSVGEMADAVRDDEG